MPNQIDDVKITSIMTVWLIAGLDPYPWEPLDPATEKWVGLTPPPRSRCWKSRKGRIHLLQASSWVGVAVQLVAVSFSPYPSSSSSV